MPPAKEQILREVETRLKTISGLVVRRSTTEIDFNKFPFAIINMGGSTQLEDAQTTGRDREEMVFSIIIGVKPTNLDENLDAALIDLERDVIHALLLSDPKFSGLARVLKTDASEPDYGDEQGHGHEAAQTLSFLADYETAEHDPDTIITG